MDLCRHIGINNFYMPSFFYMKLGVNIKFADNFVEGNSQNMAVFLHEYIHYLQDISTTYGYMQIHNSIEHLNAYLYYAQQSSDGLLRRTMINDDKAIQLDDYIKYTMGDSKESSYECYDSMKIVKISTSFSQTEIEENSDSEDEKKYWKTCVVPRLQLELKKNHTTDIVSFDFGAMAISESMAALIQNHIFPQKNRMYMQIQYDIAKLLYNYIMGQDGRDSSIVELCDISLMDNNPGRFYVLTLYEMKRKGFYPKSIGDVAKFAEGVWSPFNKLFNDNYQFAKNSIIKIFKGEKEGFLNLRNYTIRVLQNGKLFRERNFDFIYKIMELPCHAAKDYWHELTNEFHFPLVITKDGECFGGMQDKNEKYNEIFYLAYHTLRNIIYKHGATHCELIDICKQQIEDCVNDECKIKVAPWRKLAEGNMCPLAVLWEMWNLDGKFVLYE